MVIGIPGAGKSQANPVAVASPSCDRCYVQVIKAIMKLFTRLKWKAGQEYLVLAFQATNASQLGGDTIHHALSYSPFRTNTSPNVDLKRSTGLALVRWILLDETSMVSAEQFNDMHTLLERTHQSNQYRKDSNDVVRNFAGINLVGFGDLYQCAPTGGHSICELPDGFRDETDLPPLTSLNAKAGLDLAWDATGVTELTTQHRCQDRWLQQVQNQCRDKKLSEENHAFLHGDATDGTGKSHKDEAGIVQVDCDPCAFMEGDEAIHEGKPVTVIAVHAACSCEDGGSSDAHIEIRTLEVSKR